MSRFESTRDQWMTELDSLHRPADAEFLYDPLTHEGRIRRANLKRYLSLIAAGPPQIVPDRCGLSVTWPPAIVARRAGPRWPKSMSSSLSMLIWSRFAGET